ncbi:MAG: T9SS type A sorting domain-containing protein [Tenuifilaceae bacterium]
MQEILRLSKLFFLFVLVQITLKTVSAQEIKKQRSSLCLSGTSKEFYNQGQEYIVQQSIGQPGVIGLSKANGLILRQGFIQPPLNLGRTNTLNYLHASIYPNPFSNSIIVTITDIITEKIYVAVYDIYGRKVFDKSYNAIQNFSIELGIIPPGFYLLIMKSDAKSITKKLIKG